MHSTCIMISALYPGMIRFTVLVKSGEKTIAVFRTNSFEYSPLVPLAAANIATQIFDEWEQEIRNNPMGFILNHRKVVPENPVVTPSDLVILQGSPRGDGNCSILAGWAVDAAHEAGRTSQVIFPHDMDIRCCIGCYQCYNTGTCVFDDDMSIWVVSSMQFEGHLFLSCVLRFTRIRFQEGSSW